jgi:hypothetical protein
MDDMNIYPFFLECSKRQTDKIRKQYLEKLTFGRGALIMSKPAGKVLVTSSGEFIIPTSYTEKARQKLERLLWDTNSDYSKMEEEIKESRKTWTNVKKRDKLHIIDQFVIDQKLPVLKERRLLKSIITIALILKLIQNQDIEYQNFTITKLKGNFDTSYFDNYFSDTTLKIPTENKLLLKTFWLKSLDKQQDHLDEDDPFD